MSRSGYSNSCDGWDLIRYRGAVKSAIRGARGQAFLRELLETLDALPAPRLIENDFASRGEIVDFCALGAVAARRGLDLSKYDVEYPRGVCREFGIADALANEIMFENDEGAGYWKKETPEQRFARVRQWVADQITPESSASGDPK